VRYEPPVLHINSAGECEAPPRPRHGTATLTVCGVGSVTLDPLLPRDEFDRRRARWDELAKIGFPERGAR